MTWCNTYTGRKVFPLDLKPEDICLRDVAHALAGRMRYMAHCWVSVAQHSVVVARCAQAAGAPADIIKYALCHDAHEAYFPDTPRPLKQDPRMAWFLEIESKAQDIVLEGLGVPKPAQEDYDRIHLLDIAVCHAEARSGFSGIHADWRFPPLDKRLEAIVNPAYLTLWDPATAEKRFLKTCRAFGIK